MSDISIGNIYAELAFDTSGLEKSKAEAVDKMKKLKAEEEDIAKKMGENVTEYAKIKIKELQENQAQCLKIIEDLEANIKKKREADLKALGDNLMTHVTGPLKSFAEDAIKTFANFEQSMQNVFSVMGASEQDMQLLTETAKKMGETTRFSASQAAQALYSLGSAGQSATQATKSLQGVLRLAGATGSDLAYTSETIASTLSQFNLEANKASHIADVFSMAISKSQANMTKLSYSMKYVGPVASGLGISLETTTAALMQLYNTGFGGEQAGTYLRNALQKLASGTDELKNKLAGLGIAYSDINPQTNNFANILNTLKEHGVGVAEAISIFGEASGGAMAKLIESGGDAVSTMESVLVSSEGSAEAMQKIQNASFANTQAELSSAFEAVKISVGEILMPAVNAIAQGFTLILQTINSLPVGIKTFAVSLGVIVASVGVLLTVPSLISAIRIAVQALNLTMMQNPIFLGMAAVATAAAAIYSIFQNAKSEYESVIEEAKKGIEEIKQLQEEATTAGNKGRAINSLLEKYEAMSRITNRTKEQQEEYNDTLTKLKELIPSLVINVDELGNAYIKNTDKVKLASKELLLEEQKKNYRAKVQAISIRNYTKKMWQDVQADYDKQDKKVDKIVKIQDNAKDIQALVEQVNNAVSNEAHNNFIKRLKKELIKAIKTNYKNYIPARFLKEMEGTGGMTGDIKDPKKWINNANLDTLKSLVTETDLNLSKSYKTLDERLQKILEIRDAYNKAENELNMLGDIEKQIEDALKPQPKQTISEYLNKLLENIYKKYDFTKQRDGKAFNKNSFLVNELRTLIDTATKQDANEFNEERTISFKDINELLFQRDNINEHLHDLYQRLLKQSQNTTKNTPKPSPKEAKTQDNSLQGKLKKLDDLFQKQIKLAKEYGKETYNIELEWIEKRKTLLQQDINNRYDTKLKAYQKELKDLKQQLQEEQDLIKKGGGNKEKALDLEKQIKIAEHKINEQKIVKEKLFELEQQLQKGKKNTLELEAQIKDAKNKNDQNKLLELENQLKEERKNVLQLTAQLKEKENEFHKSKIYQEIINTETLGGTGDKKDITIQQELNKTVVMQKELFDALTTEEAKQRKKLEEIKIELGLVLEKLAKAKEEVAILEIAPITEENNAKLELANEKVRELENKARELSYALGEGFTTLADVDEAMAKLENKNTPTFIQKIRELNEEKKKILKLIREAENNPSTTDKEREKLKKRQQELNKQMREGQAQIASAMISSFGSLATNLTSLALKIHEQQEATTEDVLDIFLEGINFAMLQVSNGTAKAVLSAIAIVFSITKMIVSYASNQKKKEEDERKKEEEERKRRRIEEANMIAGETAKIYAKHLDPVGGKMNSMDAIFNQMISQTRLNKINNFLQKLGTMRIRADDFYGFVSHYTNTINEVIADYHKALENGNISLANKLRQAIQNMTKDAMKQEGIKPEELDSLKNYIQEINKVMIEAVQNADFSTLGILLKEKLRESIYAKLQGKIIDDKIKKLLVDFEKTSNDEKQEKILKKAIEELERETEKLEAQVDKYLGILGRTNNEMDEHTKRWAEMKNSISQALSESLSESAYNADWGAFKKAFAQEMKKAIVDAVVSQAGIRTKINALIKTMMSDGKITADEINYGLNELRGIYDGIEGSLEGVAQMIKKLEGGVEVKQEVQGSIIQKLSGADRDYFSDLFKDNFRLILESFKMSILDLKEIKHAQITVLNATLSVNNVNLYATDNMSLKEFLAELINEARQSV